MKGLLRSVDALDGRGRYWAMFFFVETHPVVAVLDGLTPKHVVVAVREPFEATLRGSLIEARTTAADGRFPSHVSLAVAAEDLPDGITAMRDVEVDVQFAGVTAQSAKLIAAHPH